MIMWADSALTYILVEILNSAILLACCCGQLAFPGADYLQNPFENNIALIKFLSLSSLRAEDSS